MRRNQRGFTLMELMVVIVIVAILAAVAVPLYINYVRDAKRSEAKGAMAAIISAEQVAYQKTCSSLGSANCTYAPEGTGADQIDVATIVDEAQRNWDIHITSADANGFTLTAQGKNTADGIQVQCNYTRANGAEWLDAIQ